MSYLDNAIGQVQLVVDDGQLRCPRCRSQQIEGGDGRGDIVILPDEDSYHAANPLQTRGGCTMIRFWCGECCIPLVLAVANHKGGLHVGLFRPFDGDFPWPWPKAGTGWDGMSGSVDRE